MYFSSRFQAGRMLASKLVDKYRYENCVVIALNEGGVIVGAQIAKELHCVINLLLSEPIELPREPIAIGGITAEGNFIFNPQYNESQIKDIESEYRGVIEEKKLEKISKLNKLLGPNDLIDRKFVKGHNVILVSDGLKSSFELQLALEYLKPINIDRLIIASPLAGVNVVDWMHLNADEICCLSVIEELTDTSHYYDNNDMPTREKIIMIIKEIILNWK